MESFPFTLSLNYKMEIITIKPPLNFSILQEVICEKYDLNLAYIFYTNEERIQYEIKNDLYYSNFLIYATDENLNEIELYIRSDEQMSQQRKLSLRKRSAMRKSGDNLKNIKTKNIEEHQNEDYEIGIQCDYDYYGDTRNRKGMYDEGYTNKNFGFKERKRIYYIKQKKQMQRESQLEEEEENEDNESDSDDRSKKRKLKNKKKKMDNDDNEDIEVNKKKKMGKKGRVMIKGGGYRGGH